MQDMEQILESCKDYARVFIAIDALDKCELITRELMLTFSIASKANRQPAYTFLTGRPFFEIATKHFKPRKRSASELAKLTSEYLYCKKLSAAVISM